MHTFLCDLATEVSTRMQEINVIGRRVTLRLKRKEAGGKDSVKYMNPGQVQMLTRSETLHNATGEATLIGEAAIRLWRQLHIAVTDVRGAGLSVDLLGDSNSLAGSGAIAKPQRSAGISWCLFADAWCVVRRF
jgi:hypothetical protein